MCIKTDSNSMLIFNGAKSEYIFGGFFQPKVGNYHFVNSKMVGKVCVLIIEKNKDEQKSSVSKTTQISKTSLAPDTITCDKQSHWWSFALHPTQVPKSKIDKYAIILRENLEGDVAYQLLRCRGGYSLQ